MEQNEKKSPWKRSKQTIIYLISLFLLALIFILVSFSSQEKADKKLAELNAELTTTKGTLEKMEALQQLTVEQEKQIKDLTNTGSEQEEQLENDSKQLDEIRKQLVNAAKSVEDSEKKLKSYQHLLALEKAVAKNDLHAIEEAVTLMKEGNELELLDEADRKDIEKYFNE